MFEFLLFIVYLLVLLSIAKNIPKYFGVDLPDKLIQITFLCKVFACFALYGIYTYLYADQGRENADIFKYYDDASIMYNALQNNASDFFSMLFGFDDSQQFKELYYSKMNHWYRAWERAFLNDNRTMIRLHGFMSLFSFHSLHINQLFSAFFSLLGLVGFYSFFEKHLYQKYLAFSLLALMPSMLLWSSGMLKESIAIGVMGLFLHGLKKSLKNINFWGVVSMVILLIFWFFIKAYALFIALPLTVVYVINQNQKHPFKAYFFLLITLYACFVATDLLGPHLSVPRMLFKKQDDFIRLMHETGAGSILPFSTLKWDYTSVFVAAPQSLFNVLIYKLPCSFSGALELASLLENYALILVLCIIFYKAKWHFSQNKNIVLFAFLFVLLFFLLVGYTTPVLGAIVRYRVLGLPFLVFGLFCLLEPRGRVKQFLEGFGKYFF